MIYSSFTFRVQISELYKNILDIYESNSLLFRSMLSLWFNKNFFILFKVSMANLFLRDIYTLKCNLVPKNLHCFHESLPSLSILYVLFSFTDIDFEFTVS